MDFIHFTHLLRRNLELMQMSQIKRPRFKGSFHVAPSESNPSTFSEFKGTPGARWELTNGAETRSEWTTAKLALWWTVCWCCGESSESSSGLNFVQGIQQLCNTKLHIWSTVKFSILKSEVHSAGRVGLVLTDFDLRKKQKLSSWSWMFLYSGSFMAFYYLHGPSADCYSPAVVVKQRSHPTVCTILPLLRHCCCSDVPIKPTISINNKKNAALLVKDINS